MEAKEEQKMASETTKLPTWAGVGTSIGAGIAGAFGTPSSSSTNSSQTTNGGGEQNSNSQSSSSSQVQQLLQFLNSLKGSTTQNGTTTTTPNLSPQMLSFINSLTGRYSSLTAPSLTGYQANQIGNINANSNIQAQAANNIMASRGLATSPVAATTAANIDQNRINQITSMQEQLPLLQNNLNLQNLNAAGSFSSMLPTLTGSTQQNNNTGTTEQTQSGSQNSQQYQQTWQQLWNYLMNTNYGTTNTNSNTNTSTGGGIGGAISGGLGALMSLLPLMGVSDENLKKEIKDIDDEAIDVIRDIKPRTWEWKGGHTKDSGVVAQELETVLPQLIKKVNLNGIQLKAVNYAGLIPYLIGAVKNLDKRVGALA